jgi:hypothetical protein
VVNVVMNLIIVVVGIMTKIIKKNIAHAKIKKVKHKMTALNVAMKICHINALDMVVLKTT